MVSEEVAHSLTIQGLPIAEGIILLEGFYRDRTDGTRAWSKRFFDRRKAMPTWSAA